ncbi:MAG: FkbM family methyltransferase [Tannerella sp.]|jgi:FkbM family methyltransferase|nr:FkbM family methyltransferase [Tannerella sp.]
MDFKELLKPNIKGQDREVIAKLRRSSCPVILYGAAGDIADRIAIKLARHGLSVAAIAVDEDCPAAVTDAPTLSGAQLCTVAEIEANYPACHVLAGFVKGYARTAEIAQKFSNAKSVDYLSEIFDMEEIEPSFIIENRDFLEDFYERLSDSLSKDSFVAYLLSKIHQDMRFIPPYFDKKQYFPDGIFRLSDHESYFDCGAFTGDTIAGFLEATRGAYRRIWAAEPDRSNYQSLERFAKEQRLANIELINKGIYSHAGRLPFQEEGSMLSMIAENAQNYIEVDTIDRLVAGRPVTYIKLDVEGAEQQALEGAERTILENHPLLGISIYHKQQDLINIPAYLKKLVPEYRFYFRVHKKLAIDTVMYAVAERHA